MKKAISVLMIAACMLCMVTACEKKDKKIRIAYANKRPSFVKGKELIDESQWHLTRLQRQ